MIYQNLSLHNIAELVAQSDGSMRPQRFPHEVQACLSERGQQRALDAAGMELRFVIRSGRPQITLASEGQTWAMVAFGDFCERQVTVLADKPVVFSPQMPQVLRTRLNALEGHGVFSPHVCRIMLHGDPVRIYNVSGDIHPPHEGQTPGQSMLFYGTSITQADCITAPDLPWPAQVGRRLKLDSINLGLGGSCWCEPQVGDWIASRQDWDYAVFCLSVNMIGAGFDIDTFKERIQYIIHKSKNEHPEKPVFCITIFPHFRDSSPDVEDSTLRDPQPFRQALRDVVAEVGSRCVHLIEGKNLLTDWTGLSPDLIHPNHYGMTLIAERFCQNFARVCNEHSTFA